MRASRAISILMSCLFVQFSFDIVGRAAETFKSSEFQQQREQTGKTRIVISYYSFRQTNGNTGVVGGTISNCSFEEIEYSLGGHTTTQCRLCRGTGRGLMFEKCFECKGTGKVKDWGRREKLIERTSWKPYWPKEVNLIFPSDSPLESLGPSVPDKAVFSVRIRCKDNFYLEKSSAARQEDRYWKVKEVEVPIGLEYRDPSGYYSSNPSNQQVDWLTSSQPSITVYTVTPQKEIAFTNLRNKIVEARMQVVDHASRTPIDATLKITAMSNVPTMGDLQTQFEREFRSASLAKEAVAAAPRYIGMNHRSQTFERTYNDGRTFYVYLGGEYKLEVMHRDYHYFSGTFKIVDASRSSKTVLLVEKSLNIQIQKDRSVEGVIIDR